MTGHDAPANLLTEWARLLMASLRRAGLREVVLSPGSRSTPFAWAALHDPGLRCRTIIDERSAAFFALGHARMTGEPALLVCTSGSAAANYFPAIVEAAESALPLLVLTADRPLELQGAAAPQTIDQVKLYGDYVRAYVELGTPDPDPRMLRALPRLGARALLTSQWPTPGPVHLNARARKPLEPHTADTPAGQELRSLVDGLIERMAPPETPTVQPSRSAVASLTRACRAARRGLIVCGPASPRDAATLDAVAELARATGFPVAAEAASQLRFPDVDPTPQLDALAALLEAPGLEATLVPDLVIQLGRPPTASAWHAAVARWADSERYVIASHGWPDPSSTATAIVHGPLDETIRAVTRSLAQCGEPSGDAVADRDAWRAELADLNERARAVVDTALEGAFSEGAAVRAVVDHLPPGDVLAVGNSLPIREVDTFVPAGPRDLTVWFQRGANGIDGLISGAAGAAAASGRPTTLLVGDVSFVHDVGGLRAVRDLPAPLTVVVLDNGGGRIFDRLPMAEVLDGEASGAASRAIRDAWLTPPGVDFEAATRAFGLAFARADDTASVTRGLDRLRDSGGVLHVVLPEGGTTPHQHELRQRLAAELRR